MKAILKSYDANDGGKLKEIKAVDFIAISFISVNVGKQLVVWLKEDKTRPTICDYIDVEREDENPALDEGYSI